VWSAGESEAFPYGTPERLVEREVEPHEAGYLYGLTQAAESADEDERRALTNEACVLGEFKVLMGARMLTETEIREQALRPHDDLVAEREQRIAASRSHTPKPQPLQTTLLPPEGTTGIFKMPPKARRAAGYFERDNAAEEPSLEDPEETRSFITHPATTPPAQRRAAMDVLPRTGSDKLRVLTMLWEEAEHGATDEEIAEALRLPLNTARPRRYDLMKQGWVVESGRERPTATKSEATVWVLSEAGRKNFERLRYEKHHDTTRRSA
jgi:hypothetical protein